MRRDQLPAQGEKLDVRQGREIALFNGMINGVEFGIHGGLRRIRSVTGIELDVDQAFSLLLVGIPSEKLFFCAVFGG